MAHYAKVLDGKVTKVLVAEQDFIDIFEDDTPGEWIQTSYNTFGGKHHTQQEDGTWLESEDQSEALRKNYAGTNYHYDVTADAFYPPKKYDSWTLNTTTYLWEAPVAYPTDGNAYEWNEETTSWDAVE
jgi:hypothetical protein